MAGTSSRFPASSAVKAGVMIAASRVEAVVMATESGTSARAKKEITFEAVPPGQQETRIRPIAKGVGKLNSQPRKNPRSGISEY